MGHLFAPFIWIDDLVQRGVDMTAFFLMRRGIPKSRICYGVMAVVIMCLTGIIADSLRKGQGGTAAILALLAIFLLLVMHNDLKESEKAEEAGHAHSRSDLMRKGSLIKIMWWMFLISNAFRASTNGLDFSLAMNLGWDISFLLLYYLAGTPNVPPAQKDTVLEPARDAA